MKPIYHILCVVLIIITGCSKIRKEFYSSGELRIERIYHLRDTSTYLEKSYFRNGQLKTIGNYVNSQREGIWQGWYVDGDKYWEAEYTKGVPKPIPEYPSVSLSKETDDEWYVDTPKYLRVYVEGATPYNVNVACNCSFVLPIDTIDHDFSIGVIPRKPGKMILHIIYKLDGEFISFAEDTVFVHPKPNDSVPTYIDYEQIDTVLLIPPFGP